jgi:acyl carrier protein
VPAETHVGRNPIGRDEVLRMVRERLAEILEIDEARITLESDFGGDLDADSLALIELVEALEEELGERTVGFSFDDEDLADLHTVRDAVDYIMVRLGEADAAASGGGSRAT